MEFETIPNDAMVQKISYEPRFSSVCSVGKEAFYGTLLINFLPVNTLIEYISFEEWLHSLSLQETTIEELCRLIFDTLTEALGSGASLEVTVVADTTVHAKASATISTEGYR